MEVCSKVRLQEDRTSAMNILTTLAIDFAASSTRSSTHDNEKHKGKLVSIYKHCKKQWHTKEQYWKLHGRPSEDKKQPPNDKQNPGWAYVSEFARPSQPNVNQNDPLV